MHEKGRVTRRTAIRMKMRREAAGESGKKGRERWINCVALSSQGSII